MTIRLGDLAPDFTAETTQGALHFYAWKGNSWAVFLLRLDSKGVEIETASPISTRHP